MNLHDAIQQAREWADGYKALLDGFGETVDADTDGGYLTVLALLTALDDADRLPRGTSFARRLTPGMGGEEWSWQGRGFRGHSATLTEAIADALAAAERKAQQ